MAEREQHGAQDDDDSNFDERGPVLQVGAFARAPDVDGGDHGDHGDGDEGGFERSERNDFGEIAGEGAGKSGDGAAGNQQEQAGSEENAGADDGADEEKEEVAFAEGAEEGGHSRGMIVRDLGKKKRKASAAVLRT